jgi:hypothetical protein
VRQAYQEFDSTRSKTTCLKVVETQSGDTLSYCVFAFKNGKQPDEEIDETATAEQSRDDTTRFSAPSGMSPDVLATEVEAVLRLNDACEDEAHYWTQSARYAPV